MPERPFEDRVADAVAAKLKATISMALATTSAEPDWRSLLVKYIRHVKEEEGVHFVDEDASKPEFMSENEWSLLTAAAADAMNPNYGALNQ